MAYNAKKKKSYTVVCQKTFFHQRVGEKNFTPDQITHIPRQKSNGRPLTREYVGQSVAEFVIIS